MLSGLTRQQLESYWKDGAVYPLTAFEPHKALDMISGFEEIKKRMAGWTSSKQLMKVHLVSRWVCEVATNSRILDAVECLLGPNILLYGTTFFAKSPSRSLHVGWHQDLLYWGLQPPDGVATVWLALSDAKQDNGAMQFIRGSHLNGFRQHSNELDENNMLNSDQNVELTDKDLAAADTVELEPGQFSIHHSMTVHGSAPNISDRPGSGFRSTISLQTSFS